LDETNFLDATLTRAVLIGAKGWHTNFMNGDLSEIYAPKSSFRQGQFNRTNLEGANFVGADLRESNFSHANLTQANLQDTNLQDAMLNSANLTGARLDSADLRRANFKGATLSSVIGLTQAQLNGACVDDQTKLPPGLNRPAPCSSLKKEGR
ncbi:MAG: pentapeptide repeat-containing protein, partial [Nitrospira sp.]|nr:pentapeptide repeat-containing protein [Nitrospira sp.]